MMMLLHEKESDFVKPEGIVVIDCTDGISDMYPILDGVTVGCWVGNYYANWLYIELYDSNKDLISNKKWCDKTTLTKDDGVYFKIGFSRWQTGIELHAEWL